MMKQVRLTPASDKLVNKLLTKLKKSKPFIKGKQDVVTLAIIQLAERELLK